MKKKQENILNASQKKDHPLHKLIINKMRIEEAIQKHGSLDSIKDIKFVQPLKL